MAVLNKVDISRTVLALIVLSGCKSSDLSRKQAAEGHGLLETPPAIRNSPRPYPSPAFQQVSSDYSSRDLFEADDGGKVKIRIRDLSLPPGSGPVTTSLPCSTLMELRTDSGTLKIAGKPQEWKQSSILMVPAKAAVELTNGTDRELIVRLYLLERQ